MTNVVYISDMCLNNNPSFNLLNEIGDALLKFKSNAGVIYSTKINIELPRQSL